MGGRHPVWITRNDGKSHHLASQRQLNFATRSAPCVARHRVWWSSAPIHWLGPLPSSNRIRCTQAARAAIASIPGWPMKARCRLPSILPPEVSGLREFDDPDHRAGIYPALTVPFGRSLLLYRRRSDRPRPVPSPPSQPDSSMTASGGSCSRGRAGRRRSTLGRVQKLEHGRAEVRFRRRTEAQVSTDNGRFTDSKWTFRRQSLGFRILPQTRPSRCQGGPTSWVNPVVRHSCAAWRGAPLYPSVKLHKVIAAGEGPQGCR